MTGFKLTLLATMMSVAAWAQLDSSELRDAGARVQKMVGKNALLQGDPATAITALEVYLKGSPNDAQARQMLAFAYMKVRDYTKAQHEFMHAYKLSKSKAGESLFYHALMLKSNMKYDSARMSFEKFKGEYKGKERKLKKRAEKEIAFCDSISFLLKSGVKATLKMLSLSVNKVNSESAPMQYSDSVMLYTSLRTDKLEYVDEGDGESGLKRKIYRARWKRRSWVYDGELPEVINEKGVHNGYACFSPDHKRLYFARCRTNDAGEQVCNLYMSEFKDNKFSDPRRLPRPVNSRKYTSTMPFVAKDPIKGNDVLYFASNRKGTRGGMDIWISVYDKKKKSFKLPKNAGAKINTDKDEISPYFDHEGQWLYFSSDGQRGLGGFDIFRSSGDGKKFGSPENLGPPLNSGADDYYYVLAPSRQDGFIVSNRPGGVALKNRTCCDDIYSFHLPEFKQQVISGSISNVLDDDDKITDVVVSLYKTDKVTKEKTLIKTTKTDPSGNFTLQADPNNEYLVVARKKDFLASTEEIQSVHLDPRSPKFYPNTKLKLKMAKRPKTSTRIPDVKYEFDKWEISPASLSVLDSTLFKLVYYNPELIVEIQSHTDGKGTEAYNNKLSQKRAESVVKYLVGKGVSPKRLRAKGYGESKPIAPNTNPDGSDNPDGRAMNRRTEFTIIGVINEDGAEESQDVEPDSGGE